MSQMMVAVQDEVHSGQDEEHTAVSEEVVIENHVQYNEKPMEHGDNVVVVNETVVSNEEQDEAITDNNNVVLTENHVAHDNNVLETETIVDTQTTSHDVTSDGNVMAEQVVETAEGTTTVIVHEDILQEKDDNDHTEQQVILGEDEAGQVIHLSESGEMTGEEDVTVATVVEDSRAEGSYVMGESDIVQFVQEEVVLSDTGNEVVNEVIVNGENDTNEVIVDGSHEVHHQADGHQIYHSSDDVMHVAEEEVVCTVPSTETEMSVAMDLANMSQGHFNPQPDFVGVNSSGTITAPTKQPTKRKSSASKAKKTSRVPLPVEEVDDGIVHEKPRMSYAQLIAEALMTREDRMLTLAEIYATISRKWPFYRMSQKTWQNAIRHNLTLNSAFQKIPRPNNEGRGNYWRMEEGSEKVIFKRAMKGGYLSKQKKNPQKQNMLTLSQQPLMIQTGGEFGGQAIVLGSGGSQTYQTIRIEKVPAGSASGTTTTATAVGRPATIIGGPNQQQKVVLISLPNNVVRQEHAVK